MAGFRTRTTVSAALVAALIAAGAFISLPIGAVPVTLQMLAVVLSALVLTAGGAFAATGIYVLLGTIGVPIFASGRAGLGVLLGPTGGFLFGFVVGATAGAWVRGVLARRVRPMVADGAAVIVVIVCTYVLGWAQLTGVSSLSPGAAFAMGVAPFVVFDAIKGAIAIAIASAIRRAGVIPSR